MPIFFHINNYVKIDLQTIVNPFAKVISIIISIVLISIKLIIASGILYSICEIIINLIKLIKMWLKRKER